MAEKSFLAKQNNNIAPSVCSYSNRIMLMNCSVRTWVCINQPVPAHYEYEDDISENGNDISEDEDYSAMASKHRKSLLRVATKFANRWTRPTRKRKCDIETTKVLKKLKLEIPFELVGLPRTRKSSTNKKPLAEGRKIKATRAPIKRYLRSARESRLNKASESHFIFDTTPRVSPSLGPRQSCAAEDNEVSSVQDNGGAACVTSSDSENYRSTSILSTTKSLKSKSDDQLDDEELTDLDNSIFDDEDLMLGDVTKLTDLDVEATLSPVERESHDSNCATDTNNQTHRHQHHPPVLPFLRAAPDDPVQEIENSPVPRLIASLRIQTCFRIAEALRLVKSTSNSHDILKPPLTIELFAKVSEISVLSNESLRLRLTDIFFPYNPPFITGTYSGKAFRGGSRNSDTIYRTIVSLPATRVRSSPSQQAGLASQYVQVLAVREANWEEITYVYGIVDPDGAKMLKKRS